ncbi:MAG: putative acyl-CoA dehydrogenase [Amycolatopsis sp.]|uniref:acyl-CoA dehydrogenase n=1 Tax=Amycolatopsis sp. TaxID=37632 RepID=UPI002612452F|nr:acyl-CoA dehydrogenase [Amycolatopsis sp.]MCU1682807.1 putative acyl-CoA dehydrogenase [Amycolatopsis sp.]
MSIGFTVEHDELTASVSGLVARHAARSDTRDRFDALAAGLRQPYWEVFHQQGLLAIHLPEDHGGGGFGVRDLGVVLEAAGHGLLPGPYLPTVLTGAVVADSGCGPARSAVLSALVAGATAAVAIGTGELVARRAESGYQITGSVSPVLGAVSAEHLVLGARLEGDVELAGEEIWFTVPASAVTVSAGRAIDLTRDIGTLSLAGLAVAADQVLSRIDSACIGAAAAALAAAEVVGIARWCLESALDYVKVREQFGRPIGSFQAVKHRCARLFVSAETAAAAAWDALRAVDEDEYQRRVAAAAAAVVCLPTAVNAALDAITLFGGVGFTWEHDVHLYWRRAQSLRALLGPTDRWARSLGKLAVESGRDFEVRDVEVDDAVRVEIASDLARVAGLPVARRRGALADLGYAAPHYPRPHGRAATPAEQLMITQELTRLGIDQPSMAIGEWVVPTLIAHGDDGQRERFVVPSLRGEIAWCQLFSEPGAGSDLASLMTKATRVDGGWRLSGQKVWISLAHEADWGACLAHSDNTVAKHKGLSYFLVDMHAEGVEVRPLRQSTGAAEFNEVFLNDVFVPDDCVVGEPGQGWVLARTTLSNERIAIGGGMSSSGLGVLRRLVRDGTVPVNGPDTARVLGGLTAQENALAALNLRSVLARLSGLEPGAAGSVSKVAGALHCRAAADAIADILGPLAAHVDPRSSEATWNYLNVPTFLLGGGTVEIQYNVIAERILGLPR